MNLEATRQISEFQRTKTIMENFDNLTVIGNRDEINEHEHRLKHFHVKLFEIINEKIINLRVSIVLDTFFCCSVTRNQKHVFCTDKTFVDRLISGEEPVTEKLIKFINGEQK